tara:strand:+ start:18113 stop:18502 length:390 start_codon:yes stop_codon:yes gene_type:complete
MPKKKSTSKAKKTSKLQGLSQAHGKDETKEFQPTTLDQVWGDTGLWKYNTMNEDEYKDQLKQMSKADLYAHASKNGIIPTDNRDLLVNKLVREFTKYVSTYRVPRQDTNEVKDYNQLPEDVKKTLGEGR